MIIFWLEFYVALREWNWLIIVLSYKCLCLVLVSSVNIQEYICLWKIHTDCWQWLWNLIKSKVSFVFAIFCNFYFSTMRKDYIWSQIMQIQTLSPLHMYSLTRSLTADTKTLDCPHFVLDFRVFLGVDKEWQTKSFENPWKYRGMLRYAIVKCRGLGGSGLNI